MIGRFITADTIVPDPYFPQTMNRYSYCYNNPLIYVDPSGHISWESAPGAKEGVNGGYGKKSSSGGDSSERRNSNGDDEHDFWKKRQQDYLEYLREKALEPPPPIDPIKITITSKIVGKAIVQTYRYEYAPDKIVEHSYIEVINANNSQRKKPKLNQNFIDSWQAFTGKPKIPDPKPLTSRDIFRAKQYGKISVGLGMMGYGAYTMNGKAAYAGGVLAAEGVTGLVDGREVKAPKSP